MDPERLQLLEDALSALLVVCAVSGAWLGLFASRSSGGSSPTARTGVPLRSARGAATL
jgi:hypothetical protein